MTEKAITAIIAILTGIITIAIIATLVSRQSDTANVLQAGASGFASIIKAAVSPLNGGTGNPTLQTGFTSGGGFPSLGSL